MTRETGLSALKQVVDLLLTLRGDDAKDAVARIVAEDPDWLRPEATRRHVAVLWADLQQSVTAEVGTALVRHVADWVQDDFAPRIVVGEHDDFVADSPVDDPYGWLPLSAAHRREAGWDFSPKEEAGTWIGWFEPEAAWTFEDSSTEVRGVLRAFIIVREGTLEFAHVVRSRRRAGIVTALVKHAVEHYGLVRVTGILTADGAALVAALRQQGVLR